MKMGKKKRFNLKKIWRARYKMYALIVMIVSVLLVHSDTRSVTILVPENSIFFDVVETNVFANKIDRSSQAQSSREIATVLDVDGNRSYLDESNIYLEDRNKIAWLENKGFVFNNSIIDTTLEGQNYVPRTIDEQRLLSGESLESLNNILRAPASPERNSYIEYPSLNIGAPILWANDYDMYELGTDGLPDYTRPILEQPTRGINTSTPVLRMLLDGVAHLGGRVSPQPGEFGNAYIVGHSSNYGVSSSTYENIFTPLVDKNTVGQTFNIWDAQGRKLIFRVFDNDEVFFEGEENVRRAYAYGRFDNRRVVTLQTCKFVWTQGVGYQANYRWLVRGELVGTEVDGQIIDIDNL